MIAIFVRNGKWEEKLKKKKKKIKGNIYKLIRARERGNIGNTLLRNVSKERFCVRKTCLKSYPRDESKESSASSVVPSAPLLPRIAPRLTNWLLRHTCFWLEPPTPKALLSVGSVSYELRPGSPYER